MRPGNALPLSDAIALLEVAFLWRLGRTPGFRRRSSGGNPGHWKRDNARCFHGSSAETRTWELQADTQV